MSILKKFVENCIDDPKYPKKPSSWHVEGMLKNKSNQIFKFDVRDMFSMPENKLGKKGDINSLAEKIVFETENDWVIFDYQEIKDYVKKFKINTLIFEELIDKLEWNVIISKNNGKQILN